MVVRWQEKKHASSLSILGLRGSTQEMWLCTTTHADVTTRICNPFTADTAKALHFAILV